MNTSIERHLKAYAEGIKTSIDRLIALEWELPHLPDDWRKEDSQRSIKTIKATIDSYIHAIKEIAYL
jgi:hypothetical protein